MHIDAYDFDLKSELNILCDTVVQAIGHEVHMVLYHHAMHGRGSLQLASLGHRGPPDDLSPFARPNPRRVVRARLRILGNLA